MTDPSEAAKSGLPASDVTAHIAFLEDDPIFRLERPYLYLLPASPEFPLSNCRFSSDTPTRVLDCRDPTYENDWGRNGFVFICSPLKQLGLEESAERSLRGGDVPPEQLLDYLEDVRAVAAGHLEASKTIVFDWRV